MKAIEFFGMPRSGKTTGIEIVESYFKQKGARVRTVYEGARVSPLDKSDRFNYNSWSFHNTTNRILEAREDHYDFILIDRGILDHLAFLDAIQSQCEGKDLEATAQYYKQFRDIQDIELFFTVEIDEAIRREVKHKPFIGRVFQRDFLEGLERAYQTTVSEAQRTRKIRTIDGNKSSKNNLRVMLEIVKTL